MQVRQTIDTPPSPRPRAHPEAVIVLVDSGGVALRVQHAFSAKVRA